MEEANSTSIYIHETSKGQKNNLEKHSFRPLSHHTFLATWAVECLLFLCKPDLCVHSTHTHTLRVFLHFSKQCLDIPDTGITELILINLI